MENKTPKKSLVGKIVKITSLPAKSPWATKEWDWLTECPMIVKHDGGDDLLLIGITEKSWISTAFIVGVRVRVLTDQNINSYTTRSEIINKWRKYNE